MRLAYEMEMRYAAQFPFINYGIDLEQMSREEAGMKISKLTSKHADTSLNKDVVDPTRKKRMEEMGQWYTEKMEELPVRNHDKIPINFVGRSHHGYMLYEIVQRKGESAVKLNEKT